MHHLLRQVADRAQERGLSLADLDAKIGAKGGLVRMSEQDLPTDELDWEILTAALTELGGRIGVRWP